MNLAWDLKLQPEEKWRILRWGKKRKFSLKENVNGEQKLGQERERGG